MSTLIIDLDQEMEVLLTEATETFGKSRAELVKRALGDLIEDLQDYHAGMEALKEEGRNLTMEEVEKELGLED